MRAAMLATVLAIIAVAPVFLLCYPPPPHAVKIDLGQSGPDDGHPHLIVVTANGEILLDDLRRADRVRLRMGLDRLMVEEDEPSVVLRPHADARYEDVVEVLAVIRRASVPHVRVAAME